jgi:hypothetical protein
MSATTHPYIDSAEVTLRYADGTSETITLTGRAMTGGVRLTGGEPDVSAPLPMDWARPHIASISPFRMQITVEAPDRCEITENRSAAEPQETR